MESNQNVFISHSSADSKLAYAMCDYLEEKGIRCWIAPRNIPVGVKYGKSIIMGIKTCKIMVVLFNRNSNASEAVETEVERAFNYKTILIPFKLDETIPSDSLEFSFGSFQWLNATKGNPEDHFDLLYQNCARVLGKKESPIKVKPVAALTPTSDKTNVETTAPATILNEIIPSKLIIGRLFYLSLFGCLNWAWFIFMIVVHLTDHRWDLNEGSNEFITENAGMWTFICGIIVLVIEVIITRNKITKKLSIFSLIITILLLVWNFLMITSNGRIDFREVSIAWIFYALIIASLNIYQLLNLYKAKSVHKI